MAYEYSSASRVLDSLLSQSPPGMRPSDEDRISSFRCCCGNLNCAFLKFNNTALASLEKDVRTAAQIGQALLERHEMNMTEAGEERRRMTACITRLEMDKRELEASNAKTIEENRNLLDQLEGLNNTVSESDLHIQSLTTTLQSTRQELQRLTILAARTSKLEEQLLALETEQANLQSQLTLSEESNRSSMQRWKRAERTIEQLHEQVDKIEREAREERERHVDVVGRMERRTAVEKELESASGRLEGAAAATTFGRHQTGGSNVVSHFVKDILQDNANLQMGIVELREMLMSSNEEVEGLREQIKLHQPLMEDEGVGKRRSTLEAELNKRTPLEALPELHVHHHYHRPSKLDGLAKDRTSVHRKPKKKRSIITPSISSPPSGLQTSRTNRYGDICPIAPSSAATMLTQTSVTISSVNNPAPPVRYSTESQQKRHSLASSSILSSPRSGFRNSSVFDSIDNALDYSRPTTAESSNPESPEIFLNKHLDDSSIPYRSFSTPNPLQLNCITPQISSTIDQPRITDKFHKGPDDFETSPNSPPAIPEMPELDSLTDSDLSYQDSTTTSPILTQTQGPQFHPQIRRATSHESLLSISGMDIHTMQPNPSQPFTSRHRLPYTLTSPTTAFPATMSTATATGRPASFQRRGDLSISNYHRSLLSGATPRSATSNNQQSQSQSTGGFLSEKPTTTLSKRVGGWVWSKWGVAPTSTLAALRSSGDLRVEAALRGRRGRRAPGVNQQGPVSGFGGRATTMTERAGADSAGASAVEAVGVDEELLRETLESQGSK